MSLDVTLKRPDHEKNYMACPHCNGLGRICLDDDYYSSNITHNLNTMADEAGIYKALWRPEEIGITKASQLIPLLENGLARLKADPDHFRKFNAPNGWGKYEHLVKFVEDYLRACKEYPDAVVKVDR